MTTPASSSNSSGIQTFVELWQAQDTLSSHKIAALEEGLKEPPNALALAISLQNMPLKDTAEWVRSASTEEIAEHKGLRTSLYIVKLLYPGFTFIPPPPNAEKGTRGDRLAIFDSPEDKRTVIFYMYKGEANKTLKTYVKTKRFDECTSVSQGMVVSGALWANKLHNQLEKNKNAQFENIEVFDLCLVQLAIRSKASDKAMENGMMLEVKTIVPLVSASSRQGSQSMAYNLSMSALVPYDLPSHSMQASVEFRTRFMEGLLVSEAKRKHLNQDLIKGNFSTTMHLIALCPEPRHGSIAVSADGKLKLFQQQPIGDVMANTLELKYDLEGHGWGQQEQEAEAVEWMAKLFNVAMMLGALELFVIVDEYRLRTKNKDGTPSAQPPADVHLQAYARINDRQILAKLTSLLSSGGSGVQLDTVASEEEDIFQYIAGEVSAFFFWGVCCIC
jgi:hypothetical protein